MTTSLKGRISGPSVLGGPTMGLLLASWERGRLARFFGKASGRDARDPRGRAGQIRVGLSNTLTCKHKITPI